MRFRRNVDGRPWRPKPWTEANPPRMFSRRILDRTTLGSWAAMVVGAAMMVHTGYRFVGLLVLLVGGLVGFVHCCVQIRLWWHELRWRNSPAPTDTLDDL